MKKLIFALSFVFVLGLVSVNAQDKKKEVKKAPAKTETAAPAKAAPAATPAEKPAKAKKVAKVKKEAAPVKK